MPATTTTEPTRYWVIDTRTNQKLGDFGDMRAADERCDVLDREAGDRFHIIRPCVLRDGRWVERRFARSPHSVSRDCPCDVCDLWFRTHGDEEG